MRLISAELSFGRHQSPHHMVVLYIMVTSGGAFCLQSQKVA
jgi:hypothetical protein